MANEQPRDSIFDGPERDPDVPKTEIAPGIWFYGDPADAPTLDVHEAYSGGDPGSGETFHVSAYHSSAVTYDDCTFEEAPDLPAAAFSSPGEGEPTEQPPPTAQGDELLEVPARWGPGILPVDSTPPGPRVCDATTEKRDGIASDLPADALFRCIRTKWHEGKHYATLMYGVQGRLSMAEAHWDVALSDEVQP